MTWIGNAPPPVYEISFRYGYSESIIVVPTNNILKEIEKLNSIGFEILGFKIFETERPPKPKIIN